MLKHLSWVASHTSFSTLKGKAIHSILGGLVFILQLHICNCTDLKNTALFVHLEKLRGGENSEFKHFLLLHYSS